MKTIVATLALMLLGSHAFAIADFEAKIGALRGKGNDSKRFKQLLDLSWKHQMDESPETATFVGFPGRNDRWSDMSLETVERHKKETQAQLRTLRTIKSRKLSTADRLSYDLFRRGVEEDFDGQRFPGEFLVVSQMGGPHQWVPQTMAAQPSARVKDFEDRIARIKAVPRLLEQSIQRLEAGLKRGITPPKITLREVPSQVKNILVDDLESNPLLTAFKKMPESIPASEQKRLRDEAVRALREQALPAFRSFHAFLAEKYVPGCRETIALSDLPDGQAWYAHEARHSTTTRLTPQEIHEIGLSEVKRLRKAMDELIASTGFKGNFVDFLDFLRTDDRFFYDKPEQLLAGYRDIAKRIDPKLIELFGKLPRTPYGVTPVPSYAEKSQTTAYYEPGSPEGGRGGYFFANTYDLRARPKWEMEALTLHEAVPGHHLQISLAEEMGDVPEFRKHDMHTAFVEGWGLYAESLGKELGMYEDPYSRFGALTYEMWRAIRLVVDTGIHAFGWSRDKSIAYFKENAAKTEHDIIVEVDRYIVWPGQALAYKIGQLKIKELRERSAAALGPKFDVRAFHDKVLENGSLPLDTLESQIKEWVSKTKSVRTTVPHASDSKHHARRG